MKVKFLIFTGFIVIFIAGGMVVYFALAPSAPINRQISKQIAKISHKKEAPPAQVPLPPTQSLAQPHEVNEIIDLLRTNFIGAPSLVGEQITPQNLNTILQKLGSQVRISATPVASISSPLAPKSEILLGNIGYWRVPSFSEKSISSLTETWNSWQKNNSIGLIIDLRDFQAANDFAGAADFAGLMVSPQTPLFTIQEMQSSQKVFKSTRQPLQMRKNLPILILINENTRGAGELLAYALREHAKGVTLGQATAGEGAIYEETKIRSSNRFVRRTTQVVLTDKGENLLGKPLVPDVSVDVDPKEQSLALLQEHGKSAADFMKELSPRKRLNEASLVKDEDVELDDVVKEKLEGEKQETPLPKDITLQRATDILRGIAIDLPETTQK